MSNEALARSTGCTAGPSKSSMLSSILSAGAMECELCKEKDVRIAYLESSIAHLESRYEYKKSWQRNYVRNRTQATRARAVERRGGKCEKCGITENLKFVRIKPIKNDRRGIESSWTIAKDKLEEQLKKCLLLCDNCRREKRRSDRENTAERRSKANLRRKERAYKELYPDK